MGVYGTIMRLIIQKIMTRDACTHNARAGTHACMGYLGEFGEYEPILGGIIG